MYFEEYKTLEPYQQVMFVLGSLITVAGIAYLLRQRRCDIKRVAALLDNCEHAVLICVLTLQ